MDLDKLISENVNKIRRKSVTTLSSDEQANIKDVKKTNSTPHSPKTDTAEPPLLLEHSELTKEERAVRVKQLLALAAKKRQSVSGSPSTSTSSIAGNKDEIKLNPDIIARTSTSSSPISSVRHSISTSTSTNSTSEQKRGNEGVDLLVNSAPARKQRQKLSVVISPPTNSNNNNNATNPSAAPSASAHHSKTDPIFDPEKKNYEYISMAFILAHPIGLKYFRAYLATEFATENLNFWLEINGWKYSADSTVVLNQAKKIIEQYIKPSAEQSINITSAAREKILHVNDTDPNNVKAILAGFIEAQQEITDLLRKDSFRRFKVSPLFSEFITALERDEKSIHQRKSSQINTFHFTDLDAMLDQLNRIQEQPNK